MILHWCFMILVALVAYLWCPSNEHNLLILLKSETFMISRLQEIQNLKAAFKMSRNIYEDVKTIPGGYQYNTKVVMNSMLLF